MTRPPETPICRLLMLCLLALNFPFLLAGQQPSPVKAKPGFPENPLLKNARPAPYRAAKQSATINTSARTTAVPCNNTTFQLRIPAAAGEQIELTEIKTFPNGNYLLAGTLTLSGGVKEGLLLVLANDGSLLQQKRFRIDNKPVIIHAADIALDGRIFIAGLFNDGTQASFAAQLNSALTIAWTRTMSYTDAPAKVTLDLYDDSLLAIAAELPGSVKYGSYRAGSGSVDWEKLLPAGTMTNLVGFNCGTYAYVTLVINRTYNGKQVVETFDIEKTTGNVSTSAIQGDATDDRVCQAVAPWSNRVSVAGVRRDALGAYQAYRFNMFASTSTETVHTWQLPPALDFTASIAIDNMGAALGYFLPSTRKLLFIKRFPDNPVTELVREYDLPNATGLAGLARSFDGGFIFGLNTDLSQEIILLKTDSLGILPVCGYQALNVTGYQQSMAPTITTTISATQPAHTSAASAFSDVVTAFNPLYDCRQNFCPVVPEDDTCLKTYHKTFRSGSYGDLIYEYHLMRNNRHLLSTARYDLVLGDVTQLTQGLKLLDERGNPIKSVDVYDNDGTVPFTTFRVDESHVMLVSNKIGTWNLTLVNDDLQKLWSKNIHPTDQFYSGGMGVSDIHKDREGNYYLVANSGNYLNNNNSVLHVYKMDGSGNDLWHRSYNLGARTLAMASSTSTASSLIIVCESGHGNVSVRIDKASGNMFNAYAFNSQWDGTIYRRHLKYDAGRIFYASTDNSYDFTIGLFDTTAQPIKLRTLRGTGNMRSANTKEGNLYGTFYYWNGSGYREVLLKVDSNLNPVFMNEYDLDLWRTPRGIDVGDAGYIYSAGYFIHGVAKSYHDSYIMKYDQRGKIGNCNYYTYTPDIVDVPLNIVPVAFSAASNSYTNPAYDLNFLTATAEFHIGAIYCSSVPDCDTIFLTDNGPICRLDADYPVTYNKNQGCSSIPQWIFDTAFVAIQRVTDSTGLFRFKQAGDTWVKAKLNNGCRIYEDSIQLNIQDMPLSLSLGADTTICPADSLTLDAGAGFAQYTWQDGSGDPTLKVKTAGKYYVEVSNSCGDRNADTITVAIDNIPSLNLGPDITACLSDSVTLQAQAGFATYTWYPAPLVAGQGPQIKTAPLSDTSISVEALTAIGCPAADTVRIQLQLARPVYIGADTSFCATDSLTMNAGSGYQQYQWSNGSTASQITVKNAGAYHIEVRDVNGCYARDTLVVQQLYTTPDVSLGADKDLCEGNTLSLDAGNFTGYEWHDGSTDRFYSALTTGNYWVTVTDNNNCKGSDSITIVNINPLPAGFLKLTDTLCQYEKLTIVPSQTYNSYEWSNGSSTSSITIDRPGQYILTVTDNEGCIGKDTIQIINKNCLSGFFVPNAFTPNRDGKNDVFRPKAYGPLTKYTFTIFNRYGERIFSTTDPYAAWDGTYNGKQSDNGTYVWQCSYQFEGRPLLFEKGIVMLIH